MITVKKGDTLSFIVRRKNALGVAMTGDALKLKSELRLPTGSLVGSFTITETTTAGDYLFVIPATETINFPLGVLEFDISYKDGVTVTSSDTYEVTVVKDVTIE